MFEKLRVVFTIPELRNKILLTLFLLLIYRVGWHIPLPVIDRAKLIAQQEEEQGTFDDFIDQVAIFSASQLNQLTIFGLGIMPYISASIIFQVLATFWAPLEKLQKEGESGRKKINEYTRYATVVICLGQSAFFVQWMLVQNDQINADLLNSGWWPFYWSVTVLTMTAGTIFLMWLGEQIDEFGIGNGISLLIMAGILCRMPQAAISMVKPMFETGGPVLAGSAGKMGIETLLILSVLFVGVVVGVVFITQGQRRIPTQSTKHHRGRRVYGGTRQYLPLRVNQGGVMPIIFASSFLLFPQLLFRILNSNFPDVALWTELSDAFQRGTSFSYTVLYVILIYFFSYFWTAITFNPKEMADQLKDHGSFIPGYRPGRRTADHLEKVMVRITYVGAGFLSLVAILPTLIAKYMQIDYTIASFYGGTPLLIAVSVAFDLVQKIDSHLVMRNYRGLLEKA
jgi:preprotein translocase subunit SecY